MSESLRFDEKNNIYPPAKETKQKGLFLRIPLVEHYEIELGAEKGKFWFKLKSYERELNYEVLELQQLQRDKNVNYVYEEINKQGIRYYEEELGSEIFNNIEYFEDIDKKKLLNRLKEIVLIVKKEDERGYFEDSDESAKEKLPDPIEVLKNDIKELDLISIRPPIDFNYKTGLVFAYKKPINKDVNYYYVLMDEKLYPSTDGEKFKSKDLGVIKIKKKDNVESHLNDEMKRHIKLLAEKIHDNVELDIDKKKLSHDIIDRLMFYYYSSKDAVYLLLTCYVYATYFFPMFYHIAVLIIQGLREAGKTTLAEALRRLVWNATGKNLSLTGANLFRKIEETRPTFFTDKNVSFDLELDRDIIDVNEGGTEKNCVVSRINPNTGRSEEYDVFCPKVLTTRYTSPFLEKSIRIMSEQAAGKNHYSERLAFIHEDSKFNEIRPIILESAIKYWKEVYGAYKRQKQTEKLTGRRFNYWSPLLALCEVFMSDEYEKLLEYAENDSENFLVSDRLAEMEDLLLEYFADVQHDEKQFIQIKGQEIIEFVRTIFPEDAKSYHNVYNAIENLGIAKKTKDSKRKSVIFRIDLLKAREKYKERYSQ